MLYQALEQGLGGVIMKVEDVGAILELKVVLSKQVDFPWLCIRYDVMMCRTTLTKDMRLEVY